MKYVYILQSTIDAHFYVGITDDLRARLVKHNAGEVPHTSKFRPWRVKTYVAFNDDKQAIKFEKYLKSPSGRAFSKSGSKIIRHPGNRPCKAKSRLKNISPSSRRSATRKCSARTSGKI